MSTNCIVREKHELPSFPDNTWHGFTHHAYLKTSLQEPRSFTRFVLSDSQMCYWKSTLKHKQIPTETVVNFVETVQATNIFNIHLGALTVERRKTHCCMACRENFHQMYLVKLFFKQYHPRLLSLWTEMIFFIHYDQLCQTKPLSF